MRSILFVFVTAGLALATPRAADACSPAICWLGSFVPGDGGRVPANVPGLFWRPMSGDITPDAADVVLASTAAPDTRIALTAQPLANGDFLLVPDEPLVPGMSYSLVDHSVCERTGEIGPHVTFSVGPEAPLPVELGALLASASGVEDIDVATTSGSCSSSATVAQTTIELAPSPSAAAWLDVLHFETRVDGEPWQYVRVVGGGGAPGASALGRGRELLYELCASRDQGVVTGLAAGAHVVTMRATLPGTSQQLMSSALEVTLACDDAQEPEQDDPDPRPDTGGCNAAGAGTAPWLALALLALMRRVARRTSR